MRSDIRISTPSRKSVRSGGGNDDVHNNDAKTAKRNHLARRIGEHLPPEQTRWLAETLQTVLTFRWHEVEQVVFGAALPGMASKATTLLNPDVSDLHVPFLRLTRIVVVTSEYNFHLVERFLTYAINTLGQTYLKTTVDVELYGDPAELHPNLRNSLTNLCRDVIIQPTTARIAGK